MQVVFPDKQTLKGTEKCPCVTAGIWPDCWAEGRDSQEGLGSAKGSRIEIAAATG